MAFDSVLDVKICYECIQKRELDILCSVLRNVRSLKKHACSLFAPSLSWLLSFEMPLEKVSLDKGGWMFVFSQDQCFCLAIHLNITSVRNSAHKG